MLKIRLRKPGKPAKGRYHFKIIVTESSSPRESKFLKEIGYYDPSQKLLKVDIQEYDHWFSKGARPTQIAASLYKRYKKQQEAVK